MAITRRQFIKRSSLATAGSFFAPAFLGNPFLRHAMADVIGDRFFVVIFLDGGNDGQNTVTPIADDTMGTGANLRTHYATWRRNNSGGIQLSAASLGATAIGNDPNTGTPLALHPGFYGLWDLYDAGKVAVIQGCGYPEYSLSHEASRIAWQTSDPLGTGLSSGWMGRYLAANYGPTDIPAVNIQDQIAKDFLTTATSVLAFRRLRNFGFPRDYWDSDDNSLRNVKFEELYVEAAACAHPTCQFLGNSGKSTYDASQSYPALHGLYTTDRESWNSQYSALSSSTANDLREVAKIIYGVHMEEPNINARFFEVRNGGYDTHSNQGASESTGAHYRLHEEVGNAVKLFYDDLSNMGPSGSSVASKTVILIYSEFSRRIQQNDNGTDHGSQGPVFVIGDPVNGGIYGNHANIGKLDNQGNTTYWQGGLSNDPNDHFRATDFRDIYGTLLKHWLQLPAGQITGPGGILPVDGGDPNYYWTTPNLDLGFV